MPEFTPKSFDGTSCPTIYLRHFDKVGRANGWTDMQVVSIFPAFMTGYADEWCKTIEDENGWFEDRKTMEKAFLAYFQENSPLTATINDLVRVRQTGSISEFYYAFTTCYQKIPGLTEGIIIPMFIKNAKKEYSEYIRRFECKTLRDCLKRGIEFDNVNCPIEKDNETLQRETTREMDEITKQLNELKLFKLNVENQLAKAEVCSRCYGLGHNAKNCSQRNKSKNPEFRFMKADEEEVLLLIPEIPTTSAELFVMAKRKAEDIQELEKTTERSAIIKVPKRIVQREMDKFKNYYNNNQSQNEDSSMLFKFKNQRVYFTIYDLLVYSPSLREDIIKLIEGMSHKKEPDVDVKLIAATTKGAPRFPAMLHGEHITTIIDGGSGINVISTSLAKKLGLSINTLSKPINITLGDGSSAEGSHYIADVIVKIGGIDVPVSAIAMQNCDYELLLGRPWLAKVHAVTDWHEGIFHFRWHGQEATITEENCGKSDECLTIAINHETEHENVEERATLIHEACMEFGIGNSDHRISLNAKLSEEEQAQFTDFINENKSRFADDLFELETTTVLTHAIQTENAEPIKQRAYRMSPKENEFIKAEIDKLLTKGFIKPSNSPWSSPVVLVKKKSGQFRFCVNYKKLNSVTIKDNYPLPNIEELLNTVAGYKYYTTLDLFSGYWQCGIKPGDEDKTTFICKYGTYAFNVMPFGLTNAPASFQRLMEIVLKDAIDNCVCVYLDDVVIFSNSFEEHMLHLRMIFEKLKIANLKMNGSKCKFFSETILFLGHKISREGISTDSTKIHNILTQLKPRNISELRTFLGMCSYYRRFVKNFSTITTPLTNLLKKESKFEWDLQQEKAFMDIREALANTPICAAPDVTKDFKLCCDASGCGIGAVLSQEIDGKERPIMFYSRKLNDAEKRYCVSEQECLAVVESLRKFRPIIWGCKITVFTDHKALLAIFNQKDPAPKFFRWLQLIADFNITIRHKEGKANVVADALSRIPETELRTINIKDVRKVFPMAMRQFLRNGDVSEYCQGGLASKVQQKAQRFFMHDNELMRRNRNKPPQLVPLTEEHISQILVENHDGHSHFGLRSTMERILSKYWWPTVKDDVELHVKSCLTCQKFERNRPNDETIKIKKEHVFCTFALDFVGPLPATGNGNRYILVATEPLTRWPIARAVVNANAETAADFIYKEIVCNFGFISNILTDRGTHFNNDLVAALLDLYEIKHKMTSAYHPKTNGLTERFNGTLCKCLAKLAEETQEDWDDLIDVVILSYRLRKHSASGYTPMELLYGIEKREFKNLESEIEELNAIRKGLIEKENSKTFPKKKNSTRKLFKVGELVWIAKSPAEIRGKLDSIRKGPFRIERIAPFNTYRVSTVTGKALPVLIHADRLARYVTPRSVRDDQQSLSGEML